MRLVNAVRLSEHPIVAIVGAGGKTSVLIRLGRELPGPVFITTTTHLGVNQAEMADRQVIIPDNDEAAPYLKTPGEKVTLFTGPATADNRLSRIMNDGLEKLRDYCLDNQITLLIEADGSRNLPLKAPAEHEPAIPEWVSDVIVVAGMQGIGKPLSDEVVHRPERFATISGLKLSEILTPDAVSKMLLHPEGGLKNIPPQSRRIALLNQADTDELKSQAGRIAGKLTVGYHQALIGALQNPGEDEISACYKPVAGIILAAGAAERYGAPKPLLEWQGEIFVRRIARTALAAGLKPVVVVTGSAGEEVQAAMADLPVLVAFNPDWRSGQASSVKTGLKALPAQTGAAVFFVADQPQVTLTILAAELERHRKTHAAIVAPMIDGKRANPVLFDRVAFEALASTTGDSGGRQVFSRFQVSWLEWNDTGLLLDVDTPQDYQRLLDTK
jgi:molybdenum cofactor cytidylyltransferase